MTPLLVVAALTASAPPPVGEWARMSAQGLGINPTEERWTFDLSARGTHASLRVSRLAWSRLRPEDRVIQAADSLACPALGRRIALLRRIRRMAAPSIPAPTETAVYDLEVRSHQAVHGVHGPLVMSGDSVSPLGRWASETASVLATCRPKAKSAS